MNLYNEPLAVQCLDEIKHTAERPFCEDTTCPCHWGVEWFREFLGTPLVNGLLTIDEALRIFYGRQLEYGNITPIDGGGNTAWN